MIIVDLKKIYGDSFQEMSKVGEDGGLEYRVYSRGSEPGNRDEHGYHIHIIGNDLFLVVNIKDWSIEVNRTTLRNYCEKVKVSDWGDVLRKYRKKIKEFLLSYNYIDDERTMKILNYQEVVNRWNKENSFKLGDKEYLIYRNIDIHSNIKNMISGS